MGLCLQPVIARNIVFTMASGTPTTTTTTTKPIIIIGAGLIGLTLAQGLKKAGFSYKIYDRDGSLHQRPAGWGITMHWALPALEACLPPELFARIPTIQVDPVEGAKGQLGSYHYGAKKVKVHAHLN